MKHTTVWMLALLLGLFTVSAEARGRHHANREAKMGKTVTVTGCLQKGDEPNEFAIQADNGKRYGLFSSGVNLSEHLGHKVTVTGNVTREHEKGEKHEKTSTGAKEESTHLNVSDLKMVSNTCP